MSFKKCSNCDEIKPLTCFYKHNKMKDGYRSNCISCVLISRINLRRTKKGLINRIYNTQKTSSRKRNHPLPGYNLVEFTEWMFAQPNFDKLYDNWKNSEFLTKLSPSCDRLDDYKPYALNNIRLVTWEENQKSFHIDCINGINNKLSKPVAQLTKERKLIKVFYSAQQASRETGILRGHITECCNGDIKTSGGYLWEFAHENC